MTWMQTFTGRKFDYNSPRPEDIDIEDIATSLARQPRFLGHTNVRYSVAQHSVMLSRFAPTPELRLPILLHDAHEAYLGDMPQPLKLYYREQLGHDAYIRVFGGLRDSIDRAIARRFGFDFALFHDARLKHLDLQALATEKLALMKPSPEPWAPLPPPLPNVGAIIAWNERTAKRNFLERFQEITASGNLCRVRWKSKLTGGSYSTSFSTLCEAREFLDQLEQRGDATDIEFEEALDQTADHRAIA